MDSKSLEWNDGEERLQGAVTAIVVGLQAYVVIAGLLSFIGWVADLPRLTDWISSGISIQPNTTIAAAAAGAALILWNFRFYRATAALAAIVTFIGGSAIFQFLTGIDLGIDSLLTFHRTWGHVDGLVPGRMGPLAAT